MAIVPSNEMEQLVTSSEDAAQKDLKRIESILYILDDYLGQFQNETKDSIELLKVGAKTALAEQIEGMVKDPIKAVLRSSGSIDQKVKGIIANLVNGYFYSKRDLLSKVYETKNPDDHLYYSIVLKDDSLENRKSVFDFFDMYNDLEINSRYPVFFQFVPADLIDKINKAGEVNLSNRERTSTAGKAQ